MSETKPDSQEKARSGVEMEQELQVQKELTLEYFSLLTRAEKQHEDLRQELQAKLQEKEQVLAEVQEELGSKDQSLAEVQEELQSQKQLTLRYYHSLAQAEAEQERLRSQIEQIDAGNRQLRYWMQGLHKEFQALLASRRWRLGHALGQLAGGLSRRNKKPRSDQRIQKILARFEQLISKQATANQEKRPSVNKGQKLIKWMEQLDKEFQAVMHSRRWKLGHSLVCMCARLIRRSSNPRSVLRMQRIFEEFQGWKLSTGGQPLSQKELRQLECWMQQLQDDFQALVASRRWKLGCVLCWPAGALRGKFGRSKSLERVQKIFAEYNSE